jgi:hypothetical protein
MTSPSTLRSTWFQVLALVLPLLIPRFAEALPATVNASESDQDATVTLYVLDKTIDGDSKSYCRLSFVEVGSEVKLKAGDKVSLRVYEDDLIGDELIWEKN